MHTGISAATGWKTGAAMCSVSGRRTPRPSMSSVILISGTQRIFPCGSWTAACGKPSPPTPKRDRPINTACRAAPAGRSTRPIPTATAAARCRRPPASSTRRTASAGMTVPTAPAWQNSRPSAGRSISTRSTPAAGGRRRTAVGTPTPSWPNRCVAARAHSIRRACAPATASPSSCPTAHSTRSRSSDMGYTHI